MAKLVCSSGPTAGHEYPLGKDVTTLGRQSSCDIQIMDHMASRQHCQVRKDGKLYTLVDLGSRNGTALNGKKVTERQLNYGDHIRVGECEWLLVKEPGDVELKDLLTKYDIGEKLGEGGMGVVFKANQKSMARTIALKVLSPKYAQRPKFVDQFIREARAAGALNHPNIIQVHDVATENNIHYFSMEFVDGPTCMQLLKANGAFPVPEALEIVRQVAKALEYAHEHRLIHQDIKPDNIMIGSNNLVKLADLGISKTFDEAEQEEGPKRVMGTPHYMAPEAALGKRIDQRVDLYSLGATLYHLLTGKTPYSGTSATEVLKAQVMDPLPAIQDINEGVSDDVCALVERLMAKKPEDRYQTATEVVEEVKRLQSGASLGTDRIPAGETMILQRLAKGGASGGGIPTPGESIGAKGTRPGTGEKDPAVVPESRRLRLVFTLGVAAVVLFLLIMLLPRMFRGADPVRSDGPVTPVGTTPAPDGAPSDDGGASHDARQAAELLDLENRTRSEGDRADLNALVKAVEAVLADQPSQSNHDRAERLRTRLSALLAERRKAQLEQAFATLRGEVDKLAEEKNFDLALARIGAFPHRDNKDLAPRVTALRDETTRNRDRLLNDLKDRIASYALRKDAQRLQELRNSLPPALLGSATENQIVAELQKLEAEAQARHQTVLKDVAADLVKWDFAKVEDRHRSDRQAMGDSVAGQTFDGFLAGAQSLPRLAEALDAVAKATAAGKVRFTGEVQKITNPDVEGATRSGLVLQAPAGSGEIEVAWKNIDPGTLRELSTQLLGGKAAEFAPAIDALAQARALAGK
jgi:hypothetical protein